MKSKEVPPFAPILIESTRAIGYSLEAAIADILDNSIAAGARNADIFFYPLGEAYVAILDDGVGMDEAQIDIAMQYGSTSPLAKRNAHDLGRFGLGLKTASLSQCRCLTVLSKKGSSIEGRRWDIDHVCKTQTWSLLILSDEEATHVPCFEKLYKKQSGTLVVWQNLDRMKVGETNFEQSMSRKMTDVRKHLSLVYHRYLAGESGLKKIAVSMNDEPLVPFDPFISKKSYQAMDDEVLKVRGQKVVIRPYILPHLSKLTAKEIEALGGKDGLRRQQGFYIYRNKRLLIWGTWFRMMRQADLSKLARIQVDLPNSLDDLWTLDIKKSSAVPPAELRKSLEAVIAKIADKSKQTWAYRGKKEVSDSIAHIWTRIKLPNSDIRYELNRDHPLIEQAVDSSHDKSAVEAMLRQIEMSLPINQLYVDLNGDERINNEDQQSCAEIEQLLTKLLAGCSSDVARKELCDRLQYTEPFSNCPSVLKKYL